MGKNQDGKMHKVLFENLCKLPLDKNSAREGHARAAHRMCRKPLTAVKGFRQKGGVKKKIGGEWEI
jgi:hypothetical protein